ncbi:MAG: O-antigen ligase family protein [Coriobacteriia bacterium]|nr:O-antigen ligase family protein [Coriobacteriia bacterium]
MGGSPTGIKPGDIPVSEAVRRWAAFGLIALVAAAALDITGRIAEVGAARFTVYQLLALAMTLFSLWLLASRRVAFPRTPVNLPLLVFLGTAVVSVVLAAEKAPAVVQLASLASSVVLVLVVAVLLRDASQGARVIGGVLAVAAVFGVLALLEWGDVFAVQHPVFYTPGYGIRARVTFLDPNIMASFLMTVVLLAVPLLASSPMSRWLRALGVAGVAVALVGLATTYSRGGLGGLVIGLACIALLVRMSGRRRLALIAVLVLALLLAGSLVLGAGWVSENVVDVGDDGSAVNRVYMVQGALKMWTDHPFGVGLDNYQLVYPEYRDPRADAGIVESHTAYVTVLAEMGFLGLIAFLWVLGGFFGATGSAARRARDATLHALAVGAFAAALGLCAQAFTYSLEASKFLWFAIGIGVAAWRMSAEEAAEGESTTT